MPLPRGRCASLPCFRPCYFRYLRHVQGFQRRLIASSADIVRRLASPPIFYTPCPNVDQHPATLSTQALRPCLLRAGALSPPRPSPMPPMPLVPLISMVPLLTSLRDCSLFAERWPNGRTHLGLVESSAAEPMHSGLLALSRKLCSRGFSDF